MKNFTWVLYLLSSIVLYAEYSIEPISKAVKARMVKGGSWSQSRGCPVPLRNLRYIQVEYLGFDGKRHNGELIMHKAVARDTVEIFRELQVIRYPIKRMKLVSDYRASDWQSIEHDNTSAFNCRSATGSKKWSKHAYGRAIDINPIENPYISKSGRIAHKASQKYRKRTNRGGVTPQDRAVLLPHSKATKIFKKHGFSWGGDWSSIKDYQHFSKP